MKKLENNLNTQSILSMRGLGYYSQRTAGAKIAIDNYTTPNGKST